MGKFVFQDVSDDSYKKRASQRGSGDFKDGIISKNFKVFASKEGSNKIRVMPPTWLNPEHYGYDVWVHYDVGADKSSYLCRKRMKNEPCPICEELASLNDKALSDKMKEKRKVIIWVIDRSDPEAGPKVFPMPWTVDKNFVLQSAGEEDGKILKIYKPEESENGGFDISFEREGVGTKTKYTGEKIARKSTPLSIDPKEKTKWLEYIAENPIPKTLVWHDYEYIKNVWIGRTSKEIEEEVGDDITESREDLEKDALELGISVKVMEFMDDKELAKLIKDKRGG